MIVEVIFLAVNCLNVFLNRAALRILFLPASLLIIEELKLVLSTKKLLTPSNTRAISSCVSNDLSTHTTSASREMKLDLDWSRNVNSSRQGSSKVERVEIRNS